MWVKICANTNLEDALLATELGADAVGFVFAPSKRQVTAAQVAAITTRLPGGVERVGVFPDWSAQAIAVAVETAGLTMIQLHGTLNLALMRELRERFEGRIAVVPVVSWEVGAVQPGAVSVAARLKMLEGEPEFDRVLVDSKVGSVTGGTGVHFDWKTAGNIFHGANQRLILAGGLTSGNVVEAIGQLQPWGVDVASGVEAHPGKKDPVKLDQFIRRAKGYGKGPGE